MMRCVAADGVRVTVWLCGWTSVRAMERGYLVILLTTIGAAQIIISRYKLFATMCNSIVWNLRCVACESVFFVVMLILLPLTS